MGVVLSKEKDANKFNTFSLASFYVFFVRKAEIIDRLTQLFEKKKKIEISYACFIYELIRYP